MPLTSMQDLMIEFMTALSLNHGCIRVDKKKEVRRGSLKDP